MNTRSHQVKYIRKLLLASNQNRKKLLISASEEQIYHLRDLLLSYERLQKKLPENKKTKEVKTKLKLFGLKIRNRLGTLRKKFIKLSHILPLVVTFILGKICEASVACVLNYE